MKDFLKWGRKVAVRAAFRNIAEGGFTDFRAVKK